MTKTYELPNEKMIMADVDEKRHMATVSVYALDDLVRAVNKSGHWILYEECAIWGRTYKCSECKTMIDIKTNYCPYCGAKMVGDNNDR